MTKDEYLALITNEHTGKVKFEATVAAGVSPLALVQDVLKSLVSKFDIDTAVGVQLDVIGLWVGFSRNVKTPLGVYFTFDFGGLGFDEGFWKGPYDPDDGLVSMDDETYRTMLRAKIEANKWDGTAGTLNSIYAGVLVGTGSIAFAIDNQNMTMDVCVIGNSPSVLISSILKNGYFPIKPCGVRIDRYFKTSVPSMPIFGFDVSNSYIGGFEEGAWSIDIDEVVYPVLDIDFVLDEGFLA